MPSVLLVIDVQQAVVEELPRERRAEFLTSLSSLIDQARKAEMPIVYIRQDGSPHELIPHSPPWEIAADVAPRGEPIVDKRFGDAFKETKLASVLASREADHLLVSGMQTDYCVNATIGGALEHGFPVTLVEDAHATPGSNGRSEQQIRDEMHRASRSRGVRVLPAAELFG
jgi:nicotinamidase-related amidase